MLEEKDINLKIIPPAKYLPIAALCVAAMLVIFLAAASYTQIIEGRYAGQAPQYKNNITVSGEGKVVARPDIGQVSLSVISDAATVAAAQKDNADKMNKVTQAMKDAGVKEEDLKTTSYSILPRYQYTSGRSDIIGYEATQTMDIKIRDLTKVGDILSKAAAAGANQVGSLSFTFDKPEALQSQARQEAITQAKQKADDLAKSLGVNLGKITGFYENSGGQPALMYGGGDGLGKGGGGGAPTPQIQTGQNEIIISVNLTYEIY